ncbi:MAG: hypothetical protein LCH87_16000 [Actinobacteria bacterium]|nr:hypothetical protein [Actinomycetota bacterium]
MKPAIVILALALILGLSIPFGVAVVVTTIVMPAAYRSAIDACLPVQDEPGLPRPVTLSTGSEALDCIPGTGELPPGPDGVCPPSGSAAERGLKPNALRALRCVKQRFPWIKYMGGVGSRPSGYVSDHPAGRAVDFMIPAWNTKAGNARGWEVAHWLQAHAKELHVKYLIFEDRSWRAYNPSAGWRAYRYPGPNPGGPTQRHLNHVHLTVYD